MGTMRRRTTRLIALALIGSSTALALTGCREALFKDNDVRSQYDRYDLVRNQYEPAYLLDEFGDEIPNIKGRLAPK